MACELLSTSDGATLVLTLRHAGRRNALGPEVYAAGVEALQAAERNTQVRSVVLTGADGHFSAGGDLQRLQANRQADPDTQARSIDGLHGFVDAIRTCSKPVVAAVEGAAAGAGFSLALACDFVVAASDAVFVMAYSNVALTPDGGATWALGRALPRPLAAALLMLGERTDAHTLQAHGLVNRVAEPGCALVDAMALAEQLNARAPNTMAAIKELLHDSQQQPFARQLDAERDHFVRALHHANAGEGIAAFLAKRAAQYR